MYIYKFMALSLQACNIRRNKPVSSLKTLRYTRQKFNTIEGSDEMKGQALENEKNYCPNAKKGTNAHNNPLIFTQIIAIYV